MRQRHPEGGAIELISMPTYDAASRRTTARFLVRGVRYVEVAAANSFPHLSPVIGCSCAGVGTRHGLLN